MGDGALEMLGMALEMEGRGMTFYENAIATCSNALGREIFTTLRDDEILHVKRIKEIHAGLSGGGGFGDKWRAFKTGHKDLQQLFRELASRNGKNITASAGDLQAIEVGLDFELKSVSFYMERLPKASDPMEHRFVEAMVQEERTHFDTLADMKFYLTDPEQWFAEKEHAGFDGA
jgi:rubrerythrin